MTTFVRSISGKLYNADSIAGVVKGAKAEDGYRYELALFKEGGEARFYEDSIGRHIVAIIPAVGWEILDAFHDEDGYGIDEVIAWGLTLSGDVVPLTPHNTNGEHEPGAFRHVASGRVYVPYDCTYENADSWLAAVRDQRAKAKEAAAAAKARGES